MSVTPLRPHPLCRSQGALHDPQKQKEGEGMDALAGSELGALQEPHTPASVPADFKLG